MNITALHAARLVSELRLQLKGSKISNLHKSEFTKKVLIQFSGRVGGTTLVFHFGGKTPYLYLLQGYNEKIVTTNFLPQLLGGEVFRVSQVGFDRIIRIELPARKQEHVLIFELFGQNCNLLLLDKAGKIITSLRKSKVAGSIYKPSIPPELLNLLEFDIGKAAGKFVKEEDKSLKNLIKSHFMAADEYLLKAWEERSGVDLSTDLSAMSYQRITHILKEFQALCKSFADPQTAVFYNLGPGAIAPIMMEGFQRSDSLSDVLHQLSMKTMSSAGKKSMKAGIADQLKRAIKRESEKLKKLRAHLERAEDYPNLMKAGELLSINIHKLKTGLESVFLEDTYSAAGGMIEIKLVKSFSPGKNIEYLFNKAKKLREKIPGIREEIRATKARLGILEKLNLKMESFEFEEVPEETKRELESLGFYEATPLEKKKSERKGRLPYKQYTTSLGEIVLVGRTSRDNDILTFKIARKNDLWFHSQQTSGSHIILRRPTRSHQFQKMSIIEAAEIAAFFSAAKNSESVPVIYTEVKYVRKARKGGPGKVIADRTKSVLVNPRRPQKQCFV